jgi:hypothetical protein
VSSEEDEMRVRRVVSSVGLVAILALGGTDSMGAQSPSPGAAGQPSATTFATPEDAVREYLAGVAAGDVERILGASAIEEMSSGFDFASLARRLRTLMLTTFLAPSEYPFFADMDRELVAARLLSQVRMLVYSLLSEEPIDGSPIILEDPARAERFVAQVDPSRLANLTVEDIRFSNAAFADDERWLANAAATAATYGADELTERLVLFSLDGKLYDLGFTLLRYGDGWKVSDQVANLAGTSTLGAARPTTAEDYDRATSGE